jgi:hypothetical protein
MFFGLSSQLILKPFLELSEALHLLLYFMQNGKIAIEAVNIELRANFELIDRIGKIFNLAFKFVDLFFKMQTFLFQVKHNLLTFLFRFVLIGQQSFEIVVFIIELLIGLADCDEILVEIVEVGASQLDFVVHFTGLIDELLVLLDLVLQLLLREGRFLCLLEEQIVKGGVFLLLLEDFLFLFAELLQE